MYLHAVSMITNDLFCLKKGANDVSRKRNTFDEVFMLLNCTKCFCFQSSNNCPLTMIRPLVHGCNNNMDVGINNNIIINIIMVRKDEKAQQ